MGSDRPLTYGTDGERGVLLGTPVAGSTDLATGSVFAGKYRVERRIALGGMGAVYQVIHLETNRRRALKIMHAHYVSSDDLRMRFRLEARVSGDIDSEHVVDVFDAGVDETTGMPFLVMELLRGEDLGRLSKRMGPLSREEVVQYLYETSLALDKSHRARIVHRDLKPDNLFLCQREHGPSRIKVLDFGIAKIVKDSETQANATRSLGTPLYMSPEQFQLKGSVSPATDIFALAMIAFTLLVGKPYWHAESVMSGEMWAFAMHVARGPVESPSMRAWELFGVELPKTFDAWFFRATAYDPASRFASAGEAIMELASVLNVAAPTLGFGGNPNKVAELPLDTNSASPQPAGSSAPRTRTGPTMLSMTPNVETSNPVRERRTSHPLVLAAASVTLLIGLGIFLVARLMTPSKNGAVIDAQPSASIEKAPAAPSPTGSSSSAIPMVEPVESSAPVADAAPSASAVPVVDSIESVKSKPTNTPRSKGPTEPPKPKATEPKPAVKKQETKSVIVW